MRDHEKTKEQLIDELNEMRCRVTEFDAADASALGNENALREREQQLKSILFASPVGIVHTRDRRIIWANHAWEEMFGFGNEQEYIGQHTSIMHPSEAKYENVRSMLYDNIGRREVSETDALLRRKDGSVFDAHIRISLLDPEDPTRGTISAIADISERRATEVALRESEEKYRLVVEKAHDGIIVAQEGILRFISPGVLEIIDYEPRELLSKPITDFIHPDDRDMVLQKHLRRLRGEELRRYSFRIVRKDRQISWVEVDSGLISWEGRPAALIFMTDITARKRAEEELQESQEKYRSLVENISDVIFEFDRQGALTYVSPVVRNVFGYGPQDLIGKTFLEFVYPEDSDLLIKRFSELRKGIDYPLEYRLVAKSGEVRNVRTYTRPIMKENVFEGSRGTLIDITERKRAEEALKAEKRRFEILAENSPFGMVMIQHDGSFSYANPKFKEMFGYDRSEVPNGREWFRKAYPDSRYRQEVISCWLEDLKGSALGETRPRVFRVTCKDGSEKIVRFRPVKLDSGQDLMTCEDITARTMAEQATRESEEKYRSLFDDSMDPIYITAANGKLIDANQSFLDLFGYVREEVIGRNILKIYAEPSARRLFRRDIDQRSRVKDYPLRLVKKNGTEMDCLITATTRKTSDGTILGYRGIIRDITERKQMEEELLQSEERYRTIVENSFDGIFIQKGLKIIFGNSRLYEMLGYSPGELEGMDHWLVYHPDYQEITRQRAIARMRGEEVTPQYEVMLQEKDGSSFLAEISARQLQVDGEPGIQVWIRDISGLRKSEEAQRRLAIAVEQAAETIVITDTTGTIQYVNPAFEQITGYSRDEAIGQNPRILQSGQHDQAFYRKLWQTITNGEAWTGQFVNKKKDGTLYREDATISPVRDSSGKIVNYVAVKRDISREFQLQAQLLHAQKMEAVGTLAGGIAHDFNNLLQVVLGYTELVLQRKQKDEKDYADLEKVYLAGQSGADLIQRLLMFSRKTEPIFTPVNLNQEVLQTEKLLSRTIPKTIKINLHLSGDLELVQADPSQIGQILMNLGVNARDAMRDGGFLTIETAMVELDEEYCQTHLGAKSGRYVLLSVSDTGQGIDKKTLAHIFEPFFSTKKAGKGTGLGLATVYGIVKQHDGYIMCYSEPGHGTTFKIYLPAIQTEEESETRTEEMPIQGGTETILLVDDEDVIRELGTTLLDRSGYEVIAADNGREAIDIYQRESERISLVILDLIMPDMDGRQCLAEILRIDPKAKVLISSGYSEKGPITGTSLTGARGFIEKPYNMMRLLGMVREVLDATVVRNRQSGG